MGGPEFGYTHNIYIGAIASLTVTDSYFHDALGGHEIKSRAAVTTITNSRIEDGPSADTSYSIDLPDGGQGLISGNVIEQGPDAANNSLIHFGGELTPVYAGSSLTVTDNTVINDETDGPPDLVFNQSTDATGAPIVPVVSGNTIYGITPAEVSDQPVSPSDPTTANTFHHAGAGAGHVASIPGAVFRGWHGHPDARRRGSRAGPARRRLGDGQPRPGAARAVDEPAQLRSGDGGGQSGAVADPYSRRCAGGWLAASRPHGLAAARACRRRSDGLRGRVGQRRFRGGVR